MARENDAQRFTGRGLSFEDLIDRVGKHAQSAGTKAPSTMLPRSM